jgi:multidrug resistance efflux pump
MSDENSFRRFPGDDWRHEKNSYREAIERGEFTSVPELRAANQSSMNYTAPGQIPPRKGRKIAIAVVTGLLGYAGYTLWDSYLRYDSVGVVEANIIGVYSPIYGFIQTLKVEEGDKVAQGDVVAIVSNNDDQRTLRKIISDISVAESKLAAKQSQLAERKANQSHALSEIDGQIAVETAAIVDLQARLKLYREDLSHLTRLRASKSASALEVATSQQQVNSTQALIKGKEQLVVSLLARQASMKKQMSVASSIELDPLKMELSSLINEKQSMEEKIAEGSIVAPAGGVVATIQRREGEKLDDDAIFSIIVDQTANMVLYYDPGAKIPELNSIVEVYSPSIGEMVSTTVRSVSKLAISPPDQIKRNFLADQKLIKVYLEPQNTDIDSFVVGSVVKKPNPTETLKSIMAMFDFSSKAFAKE